MVRINPVLHAASPWVSTMIAWVGVLTALLAATIALAQNDIKKVLAYSTISQLGYMFLAVGAGGYWAAIFHMITHAFFKALLFLGAGSVIHGMHDEQDMRRMGALRKLMPITSAAFIVGWLAIAGVPPFSGFWSKDEILAYALHKSLALYLIGLFTALLTAFYMAREVYLVFYGDARWHDTLPGDDVHAAAGAEADDATTDAAPADAAPALATAATAVDPAETHEFTPHESPWTMTVPLVVLAFFAAVAGFINLPFSFTTHWLEDWLAPVTARYGAVLPYSNWTIFGLLCVSTVVALTGITIAYLVYLRHRIPAERIEKPLFLNAWYYDRAVTAFMGGPGRRMAEGMAWFDSTVIDGAVNGIGAMARSSGNSVRRLQTGFVRTYALAMTIGTVALIVFVLTRVHF
jgi:NADH-quinone oxidoreductase subunit L